MDNRKGTFVIVISFGEHLVTNNILFFKYYFSKFEVNCHSCSGTDTKHLATSHHFFVCCMKYNILQ